LQPIEIHIEDKKKKKRATTAVQKTKQSG
jgi:hypothetical protein